MADLGPVVSEPSDQGLDAPLLWNGIPAQTVSDAAAAADDGSVDAARSPGLLSRFDDIEVLLHNEGRYYGDRGDEYLDGGGGVESEGVAWSFGSDGSAWREWPLDKSAYPVIPDGAGGIIYVHTRNGQIMHWEEPHSEPAVLLEDCFYACWLMAVADIEGSPEVVYTQSHPEFAGEDNNPFPEALFRMSLETREEVNLGQVGGHEWGIGNAVAVGSELFALAWSEGGRESLGL